MVPLLSRTELLVGPEGIERLQRAYVAVIGLGGVGGYALEALTRAGVGRFILIDGDIVDPTNLNRQILALENALGRDKVHVARERVSHINPYADVEVRRVFLTPENVASLIPEDVSHVVDAIDTVASKVALIQTLHGRGSRFVSSMGAGSKLDPLAVKVDDISKTRGCPLAKIVRQRLRKLGIIHGVPCVYSEENLSRSADPETDANTAKRPQGTISYMPAIVGLVAASVILRDILQP